VPDGVQDANANTAARRHIIQIELRQAHRPVQTSPWIKTLMVVADEGPEIGPDGRPVGCCWSKSVKARQGKTVGQMLGALDSLGAMDYQLTKKVTRTERIVEEKVAGHVC
jgi:hypothetical protein